MNNKLSSKSTIKSISSNSTIVSKESQNLFQLFPEFFPNNNITKQTTLLYSKEVSPSKSRNIISYNHVAFTKEDLVQEFIKEEQHYQQYKELRLCHRKNNSRNEEMKEVRKIPIIDSFSKTIAEKQQKKPLYTRLDEVTKHKQATIQSLKTSYNDYLNNEIEPNEHKPFKGYSQHTMKWVKDKQEWLKHSNAKTLTLGTKIKENEEAYLKMLNTPPSPRNKDFAYKDRSKEEEYKMNIAKKIHWNDFYPSFGPKLNRNRSDESRYTKAKNYDHHLSLNTSNSKIKITGRNGNTGGNTTMNTSMTMKKTESQQGKGVIVSNKRMKKSASVNMNMKNGKKIEHWSTQLMKLGNGVVSDDLYKLNICNSGAWNENSPNVVGLNNPRVKGILATLC